jgi:hypothetical protein
MMTTRRNPYAYTLALLALVGALAIPVPAHADPCDPSCEPTMVPVPTVTPTDYGTPDPTPTVDPLEPLLEQAYAVIAEQRHELYVVNRHLERLTFRHAQLRLRAQHWHRLAVRYLHTLRRLHHPGGITVCVVP